MLGDTSLDFWQDKTYHVMWTKYCDQTQLGEEMKHSLALVTTPTPPPTHHHPPNHHPPPPPPTTTPPTIPGLPPGTPHTQLCSLQYSKEYTFGLHMFMVFVVLLYTTVLFGLIHIFCFYIALVFTVYLLPLSADYFHCRTLY